MFVRDIIQRHNRLNGVTLSIVEFTAIALFIGAFATYYLLHRRFLLALIGWGITLNCVPVAVYGLRQLAHDRATGKSISSFWDREAREQHRRENPHMLRDVIILTVTIAVPFLALAALLFEALRGPKT